MANAVHPAAVVGGWEVSVRWIDVFLKAISEALPDRVCAGGKSMQCHAGFGGFDPRPHKDPRRYYCFLETLAGGYGGRRRERRARRRADVFAEHRERTRRGDRAQLPGAHRALRAHPRFRRAGGIPWRAWPAQRLSLPRSRANVHDPGRPLQVPRPRVSSGAARETGVLRFDRPRRSRAPARVEDNVHRSPRLDRHDANLRRRRLRPGRRTASRSGSCEM